MSLRGTYDQALLESQEEREDFMAMSPEDRGHAAYDLWKQNNFHMPLPTAGYCSENISWWDGSEIPDPDEYKTGGFEASRGAKGYKEDLREAKKREAECIVKCAECPFVQQCFVASITRPQPVFERGSAERKDGLVCEDEAVLWGGATYEERREAWQIVLGRWTEDIYAGDVTVTGYDRFVMFERDLRDELGDEEFERLREEAQTTRRSRRIAARTRREEGLV